MQQASAPTPPNLDAWLERLSEREMPVLSNTVQRLCSISTDEASSAGDLAGVVLQDASMTSGVLKIANSAYYNAGSREINTISRAVVLLGFDTVRSIGLSQTLIDAFLQGGARKRLVQLMQQAVYAAVQAKLIAERAGDPAAEEVFVAALLYRLGEMAFWAFASDAEAEALEKAMAQPGTSARQAQREVLGFDLQALSAGLARAWRLGDVLQDALRAGAGETPKGRAANVHLGHRLESAVREEGWNSPAVEQVTKDIARHARLSVAQTKELIEDSRGELKRAAEAFGVKIEHKAEKPAQQAQKRPEPRRPAPMLQLKILRELSAMLPQRPDVQVVLDMVLEGIYRGIAMDRTILAVLSRDRKELRLKYALGERSDHLADDFHLRLDLPEHALLRQALESETCTWPAQLPEADRARLLGEELRTRLAEDFYVGPLRIRGKPIGLIYADCRSSHRPLDQDCFEAFRHFLQQADLALDHLMGG